MEIVSDPLEDLFLQCNDDYFSDFSFLFMAIRPLGLAYAV